MRQKPNSHLLAATRKNGVIAVAEVGLDDVFIEAHTYKKAELKSFLQFHRQGQEPLRDDEISILNGVLELNNKRAESIMTPMQVHHE